MSAHEPAFTIGALSRVSDCSIDTIRYYERIRLMPPVARSPGGHRLYGEGHLRRLRLIRRSRALGLSLEQVRAVIEGAERQALGCEHARELLVTQIEAVRARIQELRRRERHLSRMLQACAEATSPNCRVLESALVDEEPSVQAGCCAQPATPTACAGGATDAGAVQAGGRNPNGGSGNGG